MKVLRLALITEYPRSPERQNPNWSLDQCLWRRRIHEVEMQEVIDTDRLEHQPQL